MNAPPFRKVVEHGHAVVADGRYTQAELAEFSLILLQLDQLGLAVRSPVSGPEKHHNGALGTQQTA